MIILATIVGTCFFMLPTTSSGKATPCYRQIVRWFHLEYRCLSTCFSRTVFSSFFTCFVFCRRIHSRWCYLFLIAVQRLDLSGRASKRSPGPTYPLQTQAVCYVSTVRLWPGTSLAWHTHYHCQQLALQHRALLLGRIAKNSRQVFYFCSDPDLGFLVHDKFLPDVVRKKSLRWLFCFDRIL